MSDTSHLAKGRRPRLANNFDCSPGHQATRASGSANARQGSICMTGRVIKANRPFSIPGCRNYPYERIVYHTVLGIEGIVIPFQCPEKAKLVYEAKHLPQYPLYERISQCPIKRKALYLPHGG